MDIWLSLMISDALTPPDQPQERKPEEEINGRKCTPSGSIACVLSERKRVEANREGKHLSEQVDQRGDFGGLGLVAVRTVCIDQSSRSLSADAGNCHSNR